MKIHLQVDWQEPLSLFIKDLHSWLIFIFYYFQKKTNVLWRYFEGVKDILVSFLIAKRGRYNRVFLNISFLFLVAAAVISGPAIAQYYPSGRVLDEDSFAQSDLPYLAENITLETTESEKPRFEIIEYEVKEGDTISNIGERFGVTGDSIKWANDMSSDRLKIGQKIAIPPVSGIVYKVKAGDTIYSLAKKYKSEAQKIVNFPANDFADLETFALNVGQVLFIPDGVPPAAAPIYRPQAIPQFIAGSGGQFMWPTQGNITQYPVSYHMAVDIANRSNPPVAASDGGVVSYAGCLRWGYGCHVIINHAEGYQTLYGHLSSYQVEAGNSVGRGQVIGRMGSTGRSTGTHLHFEIRRNGVLLNPLGFLGR